MDISALLTHNAKQDEPPTSPASSEDVTAQIERMTPIAVDEAMCDQQRRQYELDETLSLTSTIYEYRMEHGRSYHRFRDGVYLLPNDEPERERLEIVHNMFYVMLGNKLHLAPITNPRKILDLGCGTGMWGINMADLHPQATVWGIDLSPIQPSACPPNFFAQIDDIECEWTFPPNHFDFIYSRHLGQSIIDWEMYIGQMYHHCQPGGWVELSEHLHDLRSDDGAYHDGMQLWKYMDRLKGTLRQSGRDPEIALKLPRMLRKAGFKEVKTKMFKLPWGPWPSDPKLKELGNWGLLALENGAFEAFGMALFTRVYGMTEAEARALCNGAERDTWDPHVHVYLLHFVITARKPFDNER